MTPAERSRQLRVEADQVLEMIRLREHCRAIGDLTPTGSYFLDLMMYPDVDLYLPASSPEEMMKVAGKLALHDSVMELVFKKGEPGELADGLYLKPVIRFGAWERNWKIDIWSVSADVARKKQAELTDLKARMSPDQKQLILEYKFGILTAAGRTPMFSGIHIYRAVVNLGFTDFSEISNYLRENGISL
jgi:hypothetical protein